MNALTALITRLSATLALVLVGAVSTGCAVGGTTESEGGEDGEADEVVVIAEEELKVSAPVPSPESGQSCWCCCNNVCYGPVANNTPSSTSCLDVCSNYFYNNPSLGCGGPGHAYIAK